MGFRLVAIVMAAAVLLVVSIFLSDWTGTGEPASGMAASEQTAQSDETGAEADPGDDNAGDRIQRPAPEEASDDNASSETFSHAGQSLDWHAISDVNALHAELVERFEAGDVHAGYQLFELAEHCLLGPMVMHDIEEQIAAANDPETIQGLQETRDKYQAIEEPCRESELWQANVSMAVQSRWLWRSAEAGHVDAMYDVVFGRSNPVAPPREMELDGEDERLAHRRGYARQLRQACDDRALYSMGVHFSRNSPVTEGLAFADHPDVDEATARQLEGFAHRYAAAHLQGEGRPAHEARNPDHPLTPAEESRAMGLAEELLDQC